jgi:hypothetical protein
MGTKKTRSSAPEHDGTRLPSAPLLRETCGGSGILNILVLQSNSSLFMKKRDPALTRFLSLHQCSPFLSGR